MPGKRIDSPCGKVHLQSLQRLFAYMENATMNLKHLASTAKDGVSEGGSIPDAWLLKLHHPQRITIFRVDYEISQHALKSRGHRCSKKMQQSVHGSIHFSALFLFLRHWPFHFRELYFIDSILN